MLSTLSQSRRRQISSVHSNIICFLLWKWWRNGSSCLLLRGCLWLHHLLCHLLSHGQAHSHTHGITCSTCTTIRIGSTCLKRIGKLHLSVCVHILGLKRLEIFHPILLVKLIRCENNYISLFFFVFFFFCFFDRTGRTIKKLFILNISLHPFLLFS